MTDTNEGETLVVQVRLEPYRISFKEGTTAEGSMVVLQCSSEEHARQRAETEYPSRTIVKIDKL